MFHRFSNKCKKRCVVLLNSTSKMINVDFLLLVSFLHMFCFVEVIFVQTKKVININEKDERIPYTPAVFLQRQIEKAVKLLCCIHQS